MEYTPFSVAMSVYYKDDAAFFDRALRSITEEQSVMPAEIVLVCDGALSGALDSVIENYQSRYDVLKVIRLPENKGLGNALKIAVENANHDLIARMDSDDVSFPDRFRQQLDYFRDHPDTDIVGGDITEFIGSEDNIVGRRSVPVSDAEIKEYMKRRCGFNHVSVMYKKDAVLKAGGYIDWFWNEDYYLWIRMQLSGCRFANTGTVLVNVRVGEEMYARRGGRRYFRSEAGLQKLMLQKKMISLPVFLENISKRAAVQLFMPNKVRGWVFRKFAREQK